MKKKIIIISAIAIVLFVSALIIIPAINGDSVKNKPEKGKSGSQAVSANATILMSHPLNNTYLATGSILPSEEVTIQSEASGKITGLYFK